MNTWTSVASIKYGLGAAMLTLAFSLPARADTGVRLGDRAIRHADRPARRGATVPEPGLPAYPDFVAGEAVRSQLSPDGKTLAVLCAGQNSLYQARRHHRHGRLDPVHLPLRRERAAQAKRRC